MDFQDLPWGPVVIEGWFPETRIGCYDDNEYDEDDEYCAVVYLGDFLLAMPTGYHMVPHECLREVTTQDLWDRREVIYRSIGPSRDRFPEQDAQELTRRYELLLELSYINEILTDRVYMARFNVKGKARASVFISHSSKDKQFANWLYIDLANAGHNPWLDEWKIKAGESIPTRVADGISECDYMLVVLSKNAVASRWVEREWQAKYWDEVTEGKVLVIPVFLEDCEIPKLLQTKKYANFRESYNSGLETVLIALQGQKELPTGRSTRTGTSKRVRQ